MIVEHNGTRQRVPVPKFHVVCRAGTDAPTVEHGVVHYDHGAHILKEQNPLPVIFTAANDTDVGYWEALAYYRGFLAGQRDAQIAN